MLKGCNVKWKVGGVFLDMILYDSFCPVCEIMTEREFSI